MPNYPCFVVMRLFIVVFKHAQATTAKNCHSGAGSGYLLSWHRASSISIPSDELWLFKEKKTKSLQHFSQFGLEQRNPTINRSKSSFVCFSDFVFFLFFFSREKELETQKFVPTYEICMNGICWFFASLAASPNYYYHFVFLMLGKSMLDAIIFHHFSSISFILHKSGANVTETRYICAKDEKIKKPKPKLERIYLQWISNVILVFVTTNNEATKRCRAAEASLT